MLQLCFTLNLRTTMMKNILNTLLFLLLAFPLFTYALPLQEAYEVIPIDIVPSKQEGDYWAAQTLNDNGVILGYQGIRYRDTYTDSITHIQPKFWTVPGKKVIYAISEKETFHSLGDIFGPHANQKDILIYRDNQTVHVYKPLSKIDFKPKKYEMQLKNKGDLIIDFDNQGNLYPS
jgi:hypothetical protein